jgi:hypothetical protein
VMTIQGTQGRLCWKRAAARFAVIGGLAILLIAACASAFSMLVWDPAADPTATASNAVASGRSRRGEPNQTQRVEQFEESRERKILCSLIRAPIHHGRYLLRVLHKAGLHSLLLGPPEARANAHADEGIFLREARQETFRARAQRRV